jgi:hypothetical protein
MMLVSIIGENFVWDLRLQSYFLNDLGLFFVESLRLKIGA